jgi:O-antigen/teichoic acid export membrane protein
LLSAAIAYVTLLDFGMQTYAVNRMNQSYAQGRIQEFTTVFHTALSISLLVSGTAFLLLAPAVWLLPVDQWFQLEETSVSVGRMTLLVLGLQLACSLPAGVVGGVYRAVGEYARDVFFNNLQRASVLGATALLLLSGAGMLTIALVQVTGLAAHIAFVQWDLRRRHPEIRIGLSDRQWRLGLTFLAPSFLFLLMQLSGVFLMQGTTLLVGAVAGAAAVAVFAALRALANLIAQVAQALGATLWPELSAIESRGEYSRLRELYMLASKLLLSFALALGVFLHFTAEEIVAVWTGGRILFDPALMSALILIQVCQAWYLASSVVLGSSNNHRPLALAALLSTSLGLFLGGMLGRTMGASGVMWGLVIAELSIPCWLIPYRACRLVGQGLREYVTELLVKGAVVFAAIYALMSGLELLPLAAHGLAKIAGAGLIVALAATFSLLAFWLTQEQRRRALSALHLPSW